MNPKFEEQFRQEGFTEPTLIQKYVYPKLAEGKNVVGLAPTGSGKTLAYSLPLLEKILPKDGSQLLIMAPSQELAAQLTNTIRPWRHTNTSMRSWQKERKTAWQPQRNGQIRKKTSLYSMYWLPVPTME